MGGKTQNSHVPLPFRALAQTRKVRFSKVGIVLVFKWFPLNLIEEGNNGERHALYCFGGFFFHFNIKGKYNFFFDFPILEEISLHK